jgi:hypothetical protein
VTSVEVILVTNNAGAFSAVENAPSGYCLIAPVFELAPTRFVKHGSEKKKGPNLVILGETDPEKPGVKTVLPKGRNVEGKY